MEGRRVESLKVAREVAETIKDEEARKDKWKELYLPIPLWSMIRFGQWHELLREPAPPKSFRLHYGIWRLARGLALAATGRLPGAEGEHVVLSDLVKHLGRARTSEKNTERALLEIAERLLKGEIAARRQKYDDAIKAFEDAVKMEDAMPYAEPPFWPVPVRHYLGAVLLIAGEPVYAEAVYRADLVKNPNNGWAFFGLTQSLHAQQKTTEAETVKQHFKTAWAYADVILRDSRF